MPHVEVLMHFEPNSKYSELSIHGRRGTRTDLEKREYLKSFLSVQQTGGSAWR
jgi:hypothetical protein